LALTSEKRGAAQRRSWTATAQFGAPTSGRRGARFPMVSSYHRFPASLLCFVVRKRTSAANPPDGLHPVGDLCRRTPMKSEMAAKPGQSLVGYGGKRTYRFRSSDRFQGFRPRCIHHFETQAA